MLLCCSVLLRRRPQRCVRLTRAFALCADFVLTVSQNADAKRAAASPAPVCTLCDCVSWSLFG